MKMTGVATECHECTWIIGGATGWSLAELQLLCGKIQKYLHIIKVLSIQATRQQSACMF